MRKLFWGCTICGVLLSGSVISTAYFAVHHPESVAGRMLRGASYAAGIINPVSGFGPVVLQTSEESQASKDAEEPVPADPIPADPVAVGDAVGKEDFCKVEEGPIVVANSGSAPIVIREDEPVMSGVHMPLPEATGPAPAECLPAGVPSGPGTMPYCPEEQSEVLPMPHKAIDGLPMPQSEEEQECSDEDFLKAALQETFSHCSKEVKPSVPAMEPACSPPEPCKPESPAPEPEASSKAVRWKLNLFRDADEEECSPPHPEVDTMEYRPSDRSLYDYGAFEKAAPL